MDKMMDAVQRFRKIEEATAPKDDPAPVYLLDEILELARQSPESAQNIAEAVHKKLGAKSPVVKFKALRIIKHLCTKGASLFQRCMQRYAQSVRDLLTYKGEPDPFKGDVPNARVREFAKEVVEVLFNAAPVAQQSGSLMAQGKIQGFGSGGAEQRSIYTGSGGAGSSSSSRAPPPASGSIASIAGQVAEGPLGQSIASAATALGDFLQKNATGNSSRLNDSRWDSPDRTTTYGAAHSGAYSGGSFGPSGGSFRPPSYGEEVAARPAATGPVNAASVLGSEEAVVDDVCSPGGLRAEPAAEDLQRFVNAAGSLDGLRIGELLAGKMGSSNWQVVLRALCALEAVLQRGSSQACGEVGVMFQSEPAPVRLALSSAQAPVRERGAAVLKLLTGEEVVVSGAAPGGSTKKAVSKAYQQQAAAAAMPDLLGGEEPAVAGGSAGGAGGLDLLGELDSLAPGMPAAAAPAGSGGGAVDDSAMFLGLHVGSTAATAAPVSPASPASAALFGGLDMAASAGTVGAASVPAAAAGGAPLGDLFSGLSTSGSEAPAPLMGGLPGAAQPNGMHAVLPPQQQPSLLGMQQQPSMLGMQQMSGTAGGPAGQQPVLRMGMMGAQPGMPLGMAPLAGTGQSLAKAPMPSLMQQPQQPVIGARPHKQDAFDFVNQLL